MDLIFSIAICVLVLCNAFLLLLWRRRQGADQPLFDNLAEGQRRLEQALRDESTRAREESGRAAAQLREEVAHRMGGGLETLLNRQGEAQRATEERLQAFRTTMEGQFRTFGESSDVRLTRLRQELNDAHAQARAELRQGFAEFQQTVRETLTASGQAQGTQLADFGLKLEKVTTTLAQQLDKIRETVDLKLAELQTRNEAKLEEMRRTVDEKLEGTLEKRLGDSFKLVSERLEAVHKGLGEMQVMASSVGDLKRVLTNVKTRGTWGEIQLGALLEQILTAEQYSANVAPKPSSAERVEYAIRLPGRNEAEGPLWLPIDSKFPHEDYHRLADAAERGDAEAVAEAAKALEWALRKQAKDISEKYIAPPYTTDFALMFLPSEALYAEVLKRPGLANALQHDCRVVVAGPTTLAALLNSLQMGFRTLAIQKRSSEVWRVLSAVKLEFGKFGDVLANVKVKLEQASKQIENTEMRTRVINRKLKQVQELPAAELAQLLPEQNGDETGGGEEETGALPFGPPRS